MPLLKLTFADLPVDDRDAATRTGWVNTDHIETAAGHVTWQELDPVLWLELAMISGAVHFVLIGPVQATDLDSAADRAVDCVLHAADRGRCAVRSAPAPDNTRR
jgi:hypothetical protein